MAEELKPGPLCFCGLKTTKNPHPDAGNPARLLDVGAVYECIPCMNKSRHEWSHRALDAEQELRNARAQPHSQGGEAVEVVAYIDDGGALYTSKLLEIMSVESDGCEPLMTVAQHRRILAASVGSGDPVAYAAFADNGNIRMWCRSAIGMCELFDAHGNKAVPLYTAPPSPDAELVALLKDASQWFADRDIDINLARDIDAKMASLK